MVRSWLRQLFKTTSGSAGSQRRRRTPWLEALEDRTLLSASLVADINPGVASSNPQAITDVNGTAFFLANDSTHGVELWKSDGTMGGTTLVKDINPGKADGLGLVTPPQLLNVNGTVFFFAYDGNPADGTVQLWKSNGTAASTRLVKGFTPSQPGMPDLLTDVNGNVFFVADDGAHGLELWQSDGTTGGTTLVKDLDPGATGSDPAELTAVGGTLFFTATDGTNTGLWKTDGTTTTFLTAGASNLLNVGGTLYFTAPDPAHPQDGPALWEWTGGTPTPVTSLGQGSSARLLTNVNGTLAFVVDSSGGDALWTSNGTSGGTAPLQPAFTGTQPLRELTAVGSTLYFINTGSSGPELWKSNLTTSGTGFVEDLTSSTGFFGLTNVNGTLVFAASDRTNGQELRTIDATGTQVVQVINPDPNASPPHGFAAVDGKLFFAANDGTDGTELFADTGGLSRPVTTTTLTSSLTSVTAGQSVTLTAAVGGNVDGGMVTFLDGSTELGTAPVIGGMATLSGVTLFGPGAHSISAVYTGDVDFNGSVGTIDVTVTQSASATPTTTTLMAPTTSVTEGDPVTFTATASPSGGGDVDGGKIDFMDGTFDLGSVSVDANGVATLTRAFVAGPHQIVATYSGDANFSGSGSAALTVMANQPGSAGSSTTTLNASATSVVAGQSVTFTARVFPPNVGGGSVDFIMDGQDDLGSVPVDASGVAVLSDVTLFGGGPHNVVAFYTGDANFKGSESGPPLTVTVNESSGADGTATTLMASAMSVAEGTPVTLTATASPTGGGNVDGGDIDFMDGTVDLGRIAVDAEGIARLTGTFSVGTHNFFAIYSGDANFGGSEPADLVPVTVTASSGPTLTSTMLKASPASVVEGSPVTLTATVGPNVSGGHTAGGTVNFFLDGQAAPLNATPVAVNSQGSAALTVALPAGTDHVHAVYSGDPNFQGSTSSDLVVTVTPPSGPTLTNTMLGASPASVVEGSPVTLTATVGPNVSGGHTAGGTVNFFLDGQAAPLNATPVAVNSQGSAALTVALPAGMDHVHAVYSGDPNFQGSTSSDLVVTVTPPSGAGDTTTTLAASAVNLMPGEGVTFTATVSGEVGGSPRSVDGGSVMFLDNGAVFASAPVDRSTGAATLITMLGAGVHSITAVYVGDAAFNGSTSSAVTVTVNEPPVMGDVTPLVSTAVTPAPGGGNGPSQARTRLVTVQNVSGLVLQGPLFVVVRGLPSGVTLRGAAGFVRRGKKRSPFVVINAGDGTVRPNDILSVALRFSAKPNRFTVSILAGSPTA